MSKIIYSFFIILLRSNCSSETTESVPSPPTTEILYSPPLAGTTWKKKSIASLGWKQTAVQPLLYYLELKSQNLLSFLSTEES